MRGQRGSGILRSAPAERGGRSAGKAERSGAVGGLPQHAGFSDLRPFLRLFAPETAANRGVQVCN